MKNLFKRKKNYYYRIVVPRKFKIYFNKDITLYNSDRITDNQNRVFIVKNVNEYKDFDRVSHVWVMCEKVDG